MPGQRKANLKYQSPMDISEITARCIYEAIGWFRIGSHKSYLFWTRSNDRFRCSRSGWIGGDNRGFDCVSLFVMHIRQSIWSFSCSSVGFMNGDFVLCWATGSENVFSCVLEIKLRSTRIYVHKEKVSGKVNHLVGVRLWWTWGSWCWFLDHSSRDHLPFLGQDSGGNACRSLSSFGSRLK